MAELLKVETYSLGTFVYQNSSAPLPDARIETTALSTLRGNVKETVAFPSGRETIEDLFWEDDWVEMGRIKSAGDRVWPSL